MDHMQIGWILGGALLLALLILLSRGGARPLPYFSREFLLSNSERAFYTVLRQSIPQGIGICMKVRLADVLDCPSAAKQQGYFAKVSQKHLDFVLYDLVTTRILAGVELDDRSHEQPRRQARDHFVNQAMATAGIPLIRVPAAKTYDLRQIRLLLGSAMTAAA
jgi:hypothetical protein